MNRYVVIYKSTPTHSRSKNCFSLILGPLKSNILSNPNFGEISQKTAIAGESIYLDISIIAKTFGIVTCLISISYPHSK